MRPTTCLLAVVVFTALIFASDASKIVCQASPEVIRPLLTKSLRLRCSIQNNNNPLLPTEMERMQRSFIDWTTTSTRHTPLSTRHTSTSTTSSTSSTSRTTTVPRWTTERTTLSSTSTTRPTSKTTESTARGVSTEKGDVSPSAVSHVTAIVITKENKRTGMRDKVASVTPFDGAIDESPTTDHVQVEGSSDKSPVVGEQGYLQVTWTRPLDDQAGVYFCEVFALNFDNHPLSLWTSVQITSTEPSVSDLITYISEHDKQIAELVEEIKRLNDDIVLMTLNETLNTTRTHNIQTGHVISCSSNSQLISFPQIFYAIPKIFTSVPYLRHTYISGSTGGTYTINVESVTQSSFTLYCTTNNIDISVDWIAID